MDQSKNIGFAIRALSESAPDSAALVYPDTEYSFRQLWQLTEASAARMRAHGVRRGDGVVVEASEPLVVLATMFATACLGAAFVLSPGDMDLTSILPAVHRFHTDEPGLSPAPGSIAIDSSWSPADVAAVPGGIAPFEGYEDPESPWLIAHTSGTTGLPKFLAISQRMMMDRSNAVRDQFIPGQTRLCSLFPASSRPFVSRTFGALLNGCPLVVGRDPDFWKSAGVTMVSASPIQAKAFFADKTLDPRLPVVEVPGSRVDDGLAQTLLRSFEVIDNAFGAGETNKSFSNFMSLAEDGTLLRRGRKRDSEIEIVDDAGTPCPPGVVGAVRVRNRYMVPGYLTGTESEKEAFRDGWFYPGDIARWGENGFLDVVNRQDGVVNIGGFKIHALAVDRILRSVDGILDGVCFKNPKDGAVDELFAFVVLQEGKSKLQAIATAKHLCGKHLGKEMIPRIFREVAGIPRRADGSPDRQACADLVLRASQP